MTDNETGEERYDAVYYRICLSHRSDKLTVVCMQWFDEYDYHQGRFYKGPDGEGGRGRPWPS